MNEEEFSDHGVSEHAGFPNAATDARLSSLDISKLLVRHPSSTFYMRVEGDNHQELGIYNKDIVVVDRALEPKTSDLVIYWDDESFVIVKQSNLGACLQVWGVVTHTIHVHRGVENK